MVLVLAVGCSKEPQPAPPSVKVRGGEGSVAVVQVHLEPGVVVLNGTQVKVGELADRLRAMRQETPSIELHVDATAEVPYAQVVEALDAARQAGVMDVSFDSGPPKPSETPQKH